MGEIIRKQDSRLVAASVIRQRLWLSSAGEFHPHALQEPYMIGSCHTDPTVQRTAESQIPRTLIVQDHGVNDHPNGAIKISPKTISDSPFKLAIFTSFRG